jgi:hypothetical protein
MMMEQEQVSVSAFFFARPGDPLDKAAHHVFKEHGGRFVGAGTDLMTGPSCGERDVQYMLAPDKAEACRAALKNAGLRLEPTRA